MVSASTAKIESMVNRILFSSNVRLILSAVYSTKMVTTILQIIVHLSPVLDKSTVIVQKFV